MRTRVDVANDSEFADHNLSPLCVFMEKPFPECYCLNISSQKIPKMLTFCAGEYTSCAVYRQKNETDEAAARIAAMPIN